MADPDLSIIIVNWNTRDLLADCLRSVFSKDAGISLEVCVVDNASNDGSADMVADKFLRVNLVRSPVNLGYARANNLGLKSSSGKDFLLLNSDTVIDPGVLPATLRLLHSDPSIGSLGCRLVGLDGLEQESVAYEYPRGPAVGGPGVTIANGLIECAYVWGAYQLVKREVIDRVGPLDEDFFLFYEDVDWCWRMHEAGWKIAYDPSHSVVHVCRASCKRADTADHLSRLFVSELLLHRKHHSEHENAALLREERLHHGWCVAWYWLARRFSRSPGLEDKLMRHTVRYRATRSLQRSGGQDIHPTGSYRTGDWDAPCGPPGRDPGSSSS